MNIFGKVVGALIGSLFGPLGILVGVVLGHWADLNLARGGGAEAGGSSSVVPLIFALWGRIAAHGGPLEPGQSLFLQGLARNQLGLREGLAREAYRDFESSFHSASGLPYGAALDELRSLAERLYEDYFLDRQTLLWVYASGRRIAALGTVRPGLVELLDTVARAFHIFEEVGSAGVAGPSGSGSGYDEQTWGAFRPARQAPAPEAYSTLGLGPEATPDQIKKAYRSLVRQYHPDAHSGLADNDPVRLKAAERFLQVQQAYERLRQARNF